MNTLKLWLFVGAIGASAVILIMLQKGCKAEKENKAITQIATTKDDTLTRRTDFTGKEHVQRDEEVGNANVINVFEKKKFDSVVKELGIAHKQLDEYAQATAQGGGNFDATMTNTPEMPNASDTGLNLPPGWNGKGFSFGDTLLSLKGYLLDSNRIKGTYKVKPFEIDIAMMWKRKHTFLHLFRYGKKSWKVDASSPNPKISIVNIKAFKITKQP